MWINENTLVVTLTNRHDIFDDIARDHAFFVVFNHDTICLFNALFHSTDQSSFSFRRKRITNFIIDAHQVMVFCHHTHFSSCRARIIDHKVFRIHRTFCAKITKQVGASVVTNNRNQNRMTTQACYVLGNVGGHS
ncbi:hypothetical protein D3C87_1535530 [compost metagenome]